MMDIMHRFRACALLLAGSLVLCSHASAASAPADLIVVDASIATMVPGAPRVSALAVRGDRIVAMGTDDEIRALAGPATRVLDVDGRLVTPGFIEGHGHFMSLGETLGLLDLRAAGSWDDIVAKVRAASATAKPGEWIRGAGWHQEKWSSLPAGAVDGVPTHETLTAAAPRNPVMLEHASGHGVVVNAAALTAAGIDDRSPDPAGGRIVRDGQGHATGWLVDNAMSLAQAALARDRESMSPEARRTERVAQVQRAGAEAIAKGVTTFHDAGTPFADIDLYRELAGQGELPLRLYVMVGGESNARMASQLARYRTIGYAGNFLTVRAIKSMADGALGSRSALLLEPYSDDPGNTGLRVDTLETIAGTGELALAHGYQLNTHAIGDRANRDILDLYARLWRGVEQPQALRWRIEHAQHLHPADVPRFGRMGVIAAMQGVHATSDGPWVPKRLGEPRAGERTYVWRALWDAGAVIANGTDTPVEDVDPLASYRATVTRRLADGSTFHPEQRLTREEALATYTRNNAYAAFEEGEKGTLEPGKLADFVVLSHDILQVPEQELAATKVLYTVLGGRIVHAAPAQ